MAIKLPEIIANYIGASNKHDVKSILVCFSETAVVHDEGGEFHGKKAIEEWLNKTIKKYNFQFKPITIKDNDTRTVLTTEVSGNFDGSPVNLDFHFVIVNGMISSLKVE